MDARNVPEGWIEELKDTFESSFFDDRQTIYVGESRTNQYHGVRAVDLASKAGEALGVDVRRLAATAIDRESLVRAIKEAVMDGE